MQLEFHQLDRRWEHLRVRHPARQRRLLASLAEVGQQTPIVVVAAEGQTDRYVVIDGYKRIAALAQLGRDTVEAVEALRQEAGDKLRVTSISPGFVHTNLAASMTNPEVKSQIIDRMEKLAIPPAAIARAIAFAIEQPADVDVNEIVIRPTAQV